MITLLSAAPGGGKTSYAVWHVIKQAIEEGRVVYTVGIPELTLPTIQVDYEFVKSWSERVMVDEANQEEKLVHIPSGALIVVDEAWKVWKATGQNKHNRDDIEHLAMHRHYGIDFLIIAQMPSLIHKDVLAMVSKHLHIFPHWSGRKLLEWAEYTSNPRAPSARTNAVTTRYQLPTESFSLYRSASAHTVIKRKIPGQVYIVILLLLLLPVMAYFVYNNVFSKHVDGFVDEEDDIFVQVDHIVKEQPVITVDSVVADEVGFNPVLPTLLTGRYDWQSIAGCVQSEKGGCICYGDSAERFVIPLDACQIAVKHGWTRRTIKVSSPVQASDSG